ncbi:MAG: sulfatase [Candidatus Omnitrophica bacterium]|nr:sulfatase [Candidatus Omnitrophota bacterium]
MLPKIKRKVILFILGLFVVISIFLLSFQHRKINYNVVLITIDTLRADHLGCYGYIRDTSPFIDSLAKKGVVFTRAFSSSSHTAPSHASLFTSLQPVQHLVLINGDTLDNSILTMAHMFKDVGYETAAFCGVAFLKEIKQGFTTFDCKKYKETVSDYRLASDSVRSVIDWLDKGDANKKFFLWVHFYDVNSPNITPMSCKTEMVNKMTVDNRTFLEYLKGKHKIPSNFYKDDQTMTEIFNEYDAAIFFVDKELKRLFHSIEKKGLNTHTLWIITADHGEGLGNHYYEGHGRYLYNEQLRVPLIFYFSNKRYTQKRINDLVRLIDIFPTLSDLIHYPLDKKTQFIQGYSLVPFLKNIRYRLPVTYAFSQRRPKDNGERKAWEPGELYCMQDSNFKYIYHSEGKDELYNLKNDPYELKNLVDTLPKISEKMSTMLRHEYNNLFFCRSSNIEEKFMEEERNELRALGYLQ